MANKKRSGDRRVEKTHASLRQALASLIREKDYDAISVTEILERANVGRSTFYMHFTGKDELLLSGMRGMLRSVPLPPTPASTAPHEKIIRFSVPILEHVVEQRANGGATGPRGRIVLHEHLREVLTDLIAEDVKREFQKRRKAPDQVDPELLARYVASNFVLVLNWWLESGNRASPKEVDVLFRALVSPTLTSALSRR